ncbi:MAG: adenylate/guanylate cyclase domain-containing protein [Chloroflexota bacterium]|nr:adenylate/guanylate cyclase domain-containing protein [Chloroflexota bacterium]MDQ5864721.1 adenylate/guanylate cyclase domain-containing protein [Chloroflexota bacterium]
MHIPNDLPTGTVTFLFTDIEGSTQLWERYPNEARVALARHDQIIEEIVDRHEGSLVRPRGEGDSRFAVFSRATAALAAAVSIQQALYAEPWPALMPTPLRVRLALHTGEADLRDGDYYGSAVNRCARLRSVAHGGQTLLSRTTYDLVNEVLPGGVELRDLGEHQLKDLQQPEHIFELVVPGLPSDFPPLKTLDTRPNNLPTQRSPLVGREAILATVQRLLLSDGVGLLTLTGPGGMGKTRLALQIAAELIDQFQDGVFFVPLAHITDPVLVAPAIAQTLGAKQVASREMVDTLADYLSNKQLLLLLDNFEQIVSAAPVVTRLLAKAPRLKVLITSREALHLRDEQEFVLPPLGVPDLKDLPTAQALSQYEAVALFTQRARLVTPAFEVTSDNAPAVAEICYRLDGLPLAIELAAARIRLLPPQAMLSRLGSRLRLLTSGARDLPERHQTLRSTIQWSYDLLQPGEQRLFRRMSVFVGGCTLEAIEAVCNVDGTLELDVLDGVTSLVDKSLVRQDTGTAPPGISATGDTGPGAGRRSETEDEPRFDMMATIREYAMELLQDTDAAEEELRQWHVQYFLSLAEHGRTGIEGQQQELWLDRLDLEHDNIQAAVKRSIEDNDAEVALRFCGALWIFWQMRGYYNEGHKWTVTALDLPEAGVRNQARARALIGGAALSRFQQDWNAALAYSDESVAIFRELAPQEQRELGLASVVYGATRAFVGEREAARKAVEEGVSLLRQAGYKWGLSHALLIRGIVANAAGDRTAAQAAFEENVVLAKAVGNKWGLSQVFNSLGDIARIEGDYARAKELYTESLRLYRRLRIRSDIPASLHNLGHVSLAQGDTGGARGLFIEALQLQITQRNKVGIAECLAGLAGLAGAEGRPERAARLFGAAEILREALNAHVWPAERVDYERNLAGARAQMEPEPAKVAAWEKAWQEGRAMNMEEALRYALEES